MKIVVVGAGIAGLSAAIGLRRAGHEVTVFEKSRMVSEIGAAINIQPNASRVLSKWGFNFSRARLVEGQKFVLGNGATLQPNYTLDYSGVENEYGDKLYFAHRVDLHSELKLLATMEDGLGTPVVLVPGKNVVGFEPLVGEVVIDDGAAHRADLVVAADGIHSKAVKHVVGYDNPAVFSGMSAFRWLVTTEALLEDPLTATLMKDHEGLMRYYDDPENRKLVWYPCRANQIQNLVLIVPDALLSLESKEDWNSSVHAEVLFDQSNLFNPALQAMIRKAKEVKLYSLGVRLPLRSWCRDRLVVVGDAAHPMLPFQGQGGAQAIEDGAALGIVFSNFHNVDQDSISERLKIFEKIRRGRASVIQMLSNAGQDEPAKVRESLLPYVEDKTKIPSETFPFIAVQEGRILRQSELTDTPSEPKGV